MANGERQDFQITILTLSIKFKFCFSFKYAVMNTDV